MQFPQDESEILAFCTEKCFFDTQKGIPRPKKKAIFLSPASAGGILPWSDMHIKEPFGTTLIFILNQL
jgi:hypothetical protein